jgi:type VI secretion system protein VasD
MLVRRGFLQGFTVLAAGPALTACGGKPPPPPPQVVSIVITGGADQNPAPDGTPQPVAVRIYQLTATPQFERADYFMLTEHEKPTLGADDAGSQEFLIGPSESRAVTIHPAPQVQAIGVVVGFGSIDQAQWRAVAPIAATGPTRLTVAIGRLAVNVKPAA